MVPRDGKPGLDETIVEKAFSMKRTTCRAFLTKDGYNIIYIKEYRDVKIEHFNR